MRQRRFDTVLGTVIVLLWTSIALADDPVEPETCNGCDDDFDGVADNGIEPIGCGLAAPPHCKGTKSCTPQAVQVPGGCVSGAPNDAWGACSWHPQDEICDGIDNDCDGLVDAEDPTLMHVGFGCNNTCGKGLTTCVAGVLTCQVEPSAEICDGLDNDCNGAVDDGLAPEPCGTDEGACAKGTLLCDHGALVCEGEIGPSEEVCNGKDDDCDGQIDEDLDLYATCFSSYDEELFPGPREGGACKRGVLACVATGKIICAGGVGPKAEVCDGLDNDCDGLVDEPGAIPDGVDGSESPFDPGRVLGEPCGSDEGACEPGQWACEDGAFACVGAVTPQPEVCDCVDNDCDGEVDEEADVDAGEPETCKGAWHGKACVVYQGGCQCSNLCMRSNYPCPTGGYVCEAVSYSQTGEPAGLRCVIDGCWNCETKTATDEGGSVLCAPAGTVLDGGVVPPVCVCVQNRCLPACWQVTCEAPLVCTDYGTQAGTCVEDNCWNLPCGPGEVCNLGSCVANPCLPGACAAEEVCKPTDEFTSFACVGSCADVDCPSTAKCTSGLCVQTGCPQGCAEDEVCAGPGSGCVPNRCLDPSCQEFATCDPLTGACGNDPCAGILCPAGQVCEQGECLHGEVPDAGSEVDASDHALDDGGKDAGIDAAPDDAQDEARAKWALATGGGGCACSSAPPMKRSGLGDWLWLLGFSLAALRRRLGPPASRRPTL